MVCVSVTPWWISETATCVFIASSVCGCRLSNNHTKPTGRTLKTWRILTRSDLQAAILSLSFFAWRCRKIIFRLPCLIIFPWISATALRSGRKNRKQVARNARCRGNSRRQLPDCLAHGVVKLVQPLPVQSPVEDGTDFSTGQPEFDVIHLVDHRFLGSFRSVINQQKTRRRLTLIVVRITLTEPKTALAGVMLEISLARFKASMAAFNAETAPSRSLGLWDLASMVET